MCTYECIAQSINHSTGHALPLCSVVIRGEASDDAVLCTRDKTFELRVADTSNMLLLAPSLTLPGDHGEPTSTAQAGKGRVLVGVMFSVK